MKAKLKIDEEWINNCVSDSQLTKVIKFLATDKSKKDLKRLAEDRLTLLKTGPSDSQKKDAEAAKQKGNAAIKIPDYNGALIHYSASIKHDPTEPTVFSNRSLTYAKLGDFHKALDDANRSLSLNRDLPRGYQRRAEAYLGLGDGKQAYIAAKALAKKDPGNKLSADLMTQAKAKMTDKISESDAEKEAMNLISGKGIMEEEDIPEPMEDVKSSATGPSQATSAKASTKSSPEIEKYFASYNKTKEEAKEHHKNGRYDEGIKKHKECLEILEKLKAKYKGTIPDNEFLMRETITYNNIAVSFKQKQEANGTITYATKTLESGITDNAIRLKAHILRGYAYEQVDRLKLAKEDWSKVKELHPENIDASKALARITSALQADDAQRKVDVVGEALRGLEEYKTKGNDLFKASIHIA
jgi:tetratricopeptide (TPR) repeat protein